jgi:hypothetical protein
VMHAGMLESWARQCAASEQVCLLLEPSAAAVCGGLRVCERGGGSTALREAASHPEVHAGLLLGQASQSAPQPGCCWARRASTTAGLLLGQAPQHDTAENAEWSGQKRKAPTPSQPIPLTMAHNHPLPHHSP